MIIKNKFKLNAELLWLIFPKVDSAIHWITIFSTVEKMTKKQNKFVEMAITIEKKSGVFYLDRLESCFGKLEKSLSDG